MSFGDRRLDRALDNWLTQTPEDYFGEEKDDEPEEEPEEKPEEKSKNKLDKVKEPTANELMLEQGLCPYCKEKLDKVFVKHLTTCQTFKEQTK
jgi:hypothetical protein